MKRYRAYAQAVSYPGGITWEWYARDYRTALADATKWGHEEFSGLFTLHLEELSSSVECDGGVFGGWPSHGKRVDR